jgi:DNA-binding response OmpR family regulator
MRVLVVEDEPLLAIVLNDQLVAAGMTVVGPAGSVTKATRLIENVGCDIAVLDFNLRGETAEPIAAELRKRGTPFILVSGVSREQLPNWLCSALLLGKPANFEQLLAALQHVVSSKTAE